VRGRSRENKREGVKERDRDQICETRGGLDESEDEEEREATAGTAIASAA